MGKDEKILLIVAAVALVAVVVARYGSRFVGAVVSEPIAQTNLTYNQPSFMFGAPVANVLPDNANQIGVTTNADEFMYSDCGCGW